MPGTANQCRFSANFQGAARAEGLAPWRGRPPDKRSGAGEVLAHDATPLRFKARLLEAVKQIDDVRVVDEPVDFHGVEAVIVGRVEPLQAQFAFDRRTGDFVGMQAPPAPGADEPLSYSTRTFTTVVDRLRARARR